MIVSDLFNFFLMRCEHFRAVLALDAMDSSGEQHLQIDHNIYKRKLDLNGKPIEEPKKENLTIAEKKTEVKKCSKTNAN